VAERWGVLAVVSLARVSMGLHLQVVAAVAPFLMADLGLGYGEVGTLIGLFLLPGVALAVPGGLVSRRFGDKRTLLGTVVLLGLGTALLAISNGFWTALLARLIAGAGATLLTMQVAKITTDWFSAGGLSTAMGILLGTFPLGVAAVMAGLPLVASATSWRVATGLVAGVSLVVLGIVAVFLRDLPGAQAAASGSQPRLWGISRREASLMLIAGASFSLVNAGLVIFTSFVPTLLLARGLDTVQAGITTSWASWLMIGALPLSGYLIDRWKGLTWWLLGSAVLTILVCVAMPLFEPAWLWIALFGIVLAPTAVGAMALPGEVLRPETRGSGFGLFFTTNYAAFSILPAVAGVLVDLTGSTTAPLWFDAAIFAAFIPLVLWFRWVQRPIISTANIAGKG
jgi:MFS family permease